MSEVIDRVESDRKAAMFGLTGGICAGKSTARRELSGLGAKVIDADKVFHDLRRPGQPGFEAMVEIIGEEIVADDGCLDNERIGSIIFSQPELKREVEKAIHPMVWGNMYGQVQAMGEEDIAVLEMPLLTPETAVPFDGVVSIIVEPEQAIRQLIANREGFTREKAEMVINNQISNEERAAMADYLIENDGTLEEFVTAIHGAWSWMREASAVLSR